uniref:Cytochrome P450 n=1 Tax=Megaselia scalaris TaxID=36166 RepID=T1GMQ0_MEGSC
MQRLKNNQSAGSNGIPTELLRQQELPLTMSFTTYWQTSGLVNRSLDLYLQDKSPGHCIPYGFDEENSGFMFQDLYEDKVAKNEPYVGIHIFNKPALLIRDLELVKKVLIKDFQYFSNRFTRMNPHNDPLGSNNLFLIRNPMWKELRQKLTPVFTSGKMKQMFHNVDEIGLKLNEHLLSLPMDKQNGKATCKELKELCALFTTDVIASVAYGLQANSMKNPEGEFRKNGRKLFTYTVGRSIDFTAFFFLPQIIPLVNATLFTKEASKFLFSTIGYAMEEREKSGTVRNDLIDVLLTFKKQNYPHDMIVAQAAVFFTAGYETTSSTMSFALYELAQNQEIQKRLRNEIKEALIKSDGKITYELVHSLEYLGMVVQEVLRMYPPLPFLDRECAVDNPKDSYKLDDKFNPQYFPKPNTFNPERFAPGNEPGIANMPFGIGPHNCIGERFGLMQAKIGLINFLKNHYVAPNEKTQKEMVLDPLALIIAAKGGIYCDIVRDPLM